MSVQDAVTLSWNNNSYVGDELVEIFRRLTTGPGPWSKVKTIPISGASQSDIQTGLTPLTAYDHAVRSQKGGLYRVGWESFNPDLWADGILPAGAKALNVATSAVGLAITAAVWSRTSGIAEQVALTFDAPPSGCAVEVYVDTGGGFALNGTTAADATTYVYNATGHGEQNVSFKVRAVRGAVVGAYGGTRVCWTGPLPPVFAGYNFLGFGGQWALDWVNGVSSGFTEADKEDSSMGGYPNSWVFAFTAIAVPTNGHNVTQACGPALIGVRLRHYQVAFAVTDYSEYAAVTGITGC